MKFKKSDLLWLSICLANAAIGSIYGTLCGFHKGAMLIGVSVFILIFLSLSNAGFLDRLKKRDILYRSVIIGYFVNAILLPLHIFAGIFSVYALESIIGMLGIKELYETDFLSTLLITFTMGVSLNLLAAAVITAVYLFQRLIIVLVTKISEGHKTSSQTVEKC